MCPGFHVLAVSPRGGRREHSGTPGPTGMSSQNRWASKRAHIADDPNDGGTGKRPCPPYAVTPRKKAATAAFFLFRGGSISCRRHGAHGFRRHEKSPRVDVIEQGREFRPARGDPTLMGAARAAADRRGTFHREKPEARQDQRLALVSGAVVQRGAEFLDSDARSRRRVFRSWHSLPSASSTPRRPSAISEGTGCAK